MRVKPEFVDIIERELSGRYNYPTRITVGSLMKALNAIVPIAVDLHGRRPSAQAKKFCGKCPSNPKNRTHAGSAFLGNGVDVTYPPSAKALRHDIIRRGRLLSEYPFGSRTNENQLRRRNSLTVGSSRAVIIIQSTTDGGTMNAARAAKLAKIADLAHRRIGASLTYSGGRVKERAKRS